MVSVVSASDGGILLSLVGFQWMDELPLASTTVAPNSLALRMDDATFYNWRLGLSSGGHLTNLNFDAAHALPRSIFTVWVREGLLVAQQRGTPAHLFHLSLNPHEWTGASSTKSCYRIQSAHLLHSGQI